MTCLNCGAQNPDKWPWLCHVCGSHLRAPREEALPLPFGARAESGPYAGFWKRFAAVFVDSVVLTVAEAIVGAAFGITLSTSAWSEEPAAGRLFVVGVLLNWVYSAGMESSIKQATLGKMALGIEVTDLAGRRLSFGRASGRYFAKVVSAIPIFIGFLAAGFTEKKQALHDLLAGCLVVERPQGGTTGAPGPSK